MSQEREKGLALFEEIYGPEQAAGIGNFIASPENFGVKQAEWTLDWTFGSVWVSDGIERKLRSCAVLGMLVALRAESEIKAHTRMGIANGLTRKELEEIVYTAIPYVGFPAANLAKRAMLDVFAELDATEST